MNQNIELLNEAKDKIICKHKLLEGKRATGNLYFNGQIFEYTSGPYGEGYIEKGNYAGYSLISETRKAFVQQGYGWQLPLRNTDTGQERGYAIHPDGNKPGSEGCIVVNFGTLNENVRLYNMIRGFLDSHKLIEVKVI